MISMLDPKTLTVFVTGATSGFGDAICHRFHDAGAKVASGQVAAKTVLTPSNSNWASAAM